jgi:PAS domain S-box-containing protein
MTETLLHIAPSDADDLSAELDELVGLAARVTGMPIAVITRTEGAVSRVVAETGLPQRRGLPVMTPFVRDAVAGPVECVADMATDPRFRDNPHVTGAPHLRFFAGAPLSIENGAPLGMLAVLDVKPHPEGLPQDQIAMIDILARHIAQRFEMRRRRRESERRQSNLFSLVSKAPIGIVQKELDGRIVFINAEYSELLGRPRDALIGHSVREFLHPDDREPHIAAVNAAIAGDTNVQLEERYVWPSGAIVWASNSISITRDAAGQPLNLVAVARDITERRRATEEIAASERKFRAIADAMPQMVWSTLPNGFHDYYNQRWYDYTGVPEGSTDGEAWNGVFHPEDQERAFARWRHSLETGEPYEIEYRLRHSSGEYRWVLGRALAIRNAAGAIERWFGTCTDIEEIKRSEEARDLLANELSHRIKNIFAVVGGLVSLTSRNDAAARPFAQAFRERLNALSLAHEYVRPHAAGEGAPVDDGQSVHGLMRLLVQPYIDSDARRFVVDGDDAAIGPKTATALALVMHEQATNAVKYGALASAGGRVLITTEKSDGEYRLVWREEGGKLIAGPPARRGFGTDMAARSAAGQLGGKIEHSWETQGLIMRLVMPLENLQR